jgi:diguanylate cyclase (GGDEF)-like protein
VDRALEALTRLAIDLQRRMALDELLQRIVQGAAAVVGVPRASIRLLDPSGTRLMAVCRAGEPVHENPDETFWVGEGLVGWIAAERKPIRSGAAEDDPRFVGRSGKRAQIGSFLGVPLVSVNVCVGVLSVVADDRDAFTELQEAYLLLLAGIAAPHLEIARLGRLAAIDPLTGALNRRAFTRLGANQPVRTLSVCMVDVDHFKRVNDELGHAVGDEVLRVVARRLAGVVRDGDAVVRFGGEEFVLLLPDVDEGDAARVAERARSDVARRPVDLGDRRVSITISVGVAERRAGESQDEVVARADQAMYSAKRAGRNCVRLATG